MNFTAIDFETAHANYPCEIGLSRIENGIIIEKNHVSNKIAMLQEAFDMIVLEFENYLSQKLYLKSV